MPWCLCLVAALITVNIPFHGMRVKCNPWFVQVVAGSFSPKTETDEQFKLVLVDLLAQVVWRLNSA